MTDKLLKENLDRLENLENTIRIFSEINDVYKEEISKIKRCLSNGNNEIASNKLIELSECFSTQTDTCIFLNNECLKCLNIIDCLSEDVCGK